MRVSNINASDHPSVCAVCVFSCDVMVEASVPLSQFTDIAGQVVLDTARLDVNAANVITGKVDAELNAIPDKAEPEGGCRLLFLAKSFRTFFVSDSGSSTCSHVLE